MDHLQPSPSLTTARSAWPRERKRQKLLGDPEGDRESQAWGLSPASSVVTLATFVIIITSLASHVI